MNSDCVNQGCENPPAPSVVGFVVMTLVAMASFWTLVLAPAGFPNHEALAANQATCPAGVAPVARRAPPAGEQRPTRVSLDPGDGDGDDDSPAAQSPQSAWAEAFSVIARLADSGSTAASRLALEMHRHGPTIYGTSFGASDQQLKRWQSQLACAAPPCFAQG